MSDIKKKIKDLKNIISPYQKKLSDWYKKDKNAKKFKEVIAPYKNKFVDFYKKIIEIKISFMLEEQF
tara:strand:+ start:941 stop:1141 length:201 start_codon:yes stop_codon:yes gene_type:complete